MNYEKDKVKFLIYKISTLQKTYFLGLSLVLFLSSVTVFAFASYSAIEIIDNTILTTPNDVAFDSLGNLYVLDSGNGVF